MSSGNSENIDEIIEVISEAYFETVKNKYENFESAFSRFRRIQERIFSYEFYSQMRNIQESGKFEFLKNFTIHAEIIKSDNPSEKIHGKQPDIIIHIPGNNENNLLVMEIKRIDAPPENIKNDLKKLKDFIEDEILKYKYGILLIFGEISNENGNIWNPIKNKIKEEDSNDDNLKLSDYIKNQKIIILWCHKENHKGKCENISSFLVEGN
jgi:hypothetical protein